MDEASKKKWKRRFLITVSSAVGLLIGVALLWLKVGAAIDGIGETYYGIRPISTPDGQLYVRREARGQNLDVVAISRNSSVCESANPDTDLIFKYDANPLLISESKDALFVYWGGVVAQPRTPLNGVAVKQVKPGSSKSEIKSLNNQIREIDIPLEYVRRGTGACSRN